MIRTRKHLDMFISGTTLAEQNDSFRSLPGPGWVITAGVQAKGTSFGVAAMKAVIGFSLFTSENDPHGEHDFGSVLVGGERVFWKIDYYDKDLQFGSPDPADPAVTRRILTIMLASDY